MISAAVALDFGVERFLRLDGISSQNNFESTKMDVRWLNEAPLPLTNEINNHNYFSCSSVATQANLIGIAWVNRWQQQVVEIRKLRRNVEWKQLTESPASSMNTIRNRTEYDEQTGLALKKSILRPRFLQHKRHWAKSKSVFDAKLPQLWMLLSEVAIHYK